jgi:hypothetical protein
METFDYYTIDQKGNKVLRDGALVKDYVVYGWGKYGEGSVLAGQARKCYIESYDTEEEAKAAYPGAGFSSKWTEPQVNVNHLPGEDDPVTGGMYPDDYDF